MSAVLEDDVTISRNPIPVVSSGADGDAQVTGRTDVGVWQQLIDETLLKWAHEPTYFEGEEFGAPDRETVSVAIRIARHCRDASIAAPDRIVPDADGGIVFERRCGKVTESIHIWDDGTAEYYCLSGTNVVERRVLELP